MSEELRNNNKEIEINNDIAEWAREFEYKNPECDDWHGIKKREITYVRFYNGKEHVYITVPMIYEESNECLNAEQRCMAYDKLSEYVSDEFIHDTVISNYFRKEKGECLL